MKIIHNKKKTSRKLLGLTFIEHITFLCSSSFMRALRLWKSACYFVEATEAMLSQFCFWHPFADFFIPICAKEKWKKLSRDVKRGWSARAFNRSLNWCSLSVCVSAFLHAFLHAENVQKFRMSKIMPPNSQYGIGHA